MNWQTVSEILRAEVPDQAERIGTRLRLELGGLRFTVPKRPPTTRADALREVRKAAGRVDLAASRLRVSKATMYRRLRAPDSDPEPRMAGRLVR